MNLKSNFEDKKREIEGYFNLLKFFDFTRSTTLIIKGERCTEFIVETELYKVMKANSYLILYNLIEGTIVEGLNTMFLEISAAKPLRNELTELYQKICIEYKINVIKILQTPEKLNPFEPYSQDDAIKDIDIFEIKDFKRNSEPTLSGYDAYIEVIGSKDISANIDIRKIKELFPKYGISSIKDTALVVYTDEDGKDIRLKAEYILKVKTYRNKLAHGRLSYTEVGAGISFLEIDEIKKHVFKYLEEIVENIELFLTTEGYKKNVPV